ncbi:putative E3 ubiquitin-protein ligase rbrA [Prunus yedoensis var. nudiflora]|uniref:Putative E3 ubiquitin-protein ligase rbrA n=1 Tax=Prunus yedoensis var. nudiflora TaxID=2094558 RepID=A0A314XND0_PRUYE|nr:putative E3 ubiquitin-protein ligase rbrA [Prunus yedoensis var. nudiflora]
MESQASFGDEVSVNLLREEDEEEFRSCCEDDEVWKETEEPVKVDPKDDLDEFSVKMFFKGMSIAGHGDSGFRLSGIGVVMERSTNVPAIQVQKRLDFYVEEPVADYLALMDGLMEAVQNKVRRVYAFTDSELLYDQVSHEQNLKFHS